MRSMLAGFAGLVLALTAGSASAQYPIGQAPYPMPPQHAQMSMQYGPAGIYPWGTQAFYGQAAGQYPMGCGQGGDCGCGDGCKKHGVISRMGFGGGSCNNGCGDCCGNSLLGNFHPLKSFCDWVKAPCPSSAPKHRLDYPLGFPTNPYGARSPRDYFMVD